jgi:hypothetical protein
VCLSMGLGGIEMEMELIVYLKISIIYRDG